MEIEGSDGSKTQLKPNSTTVFGRGNGFHRNDLAVSRRHISFELNPLDSQTGPRVSFEVLGKNPVWVHSKERNGENKIMVLKRFQRGELGIDDMFCVCAKDPVWFTLKEVGEEEVVDERESNRGEIEFGGRVNDELSQSLETATEYVSNEGFGLDSVDVSNIDPVQEFGFLVIGHEFDQYSKQMIRDIKNWNWFLEERRGDSDDEAADEKKGKRGWTGKRKKTRGDDDVDEEWTGESEDEDATTKSRKVQRPNYHTRSKDGGKLHKDSTGIRKSSAKTSGKEGEEEYEDDEEDEEDETLGGFIVEDETVEEEEDEENEVDEEEEDDFVEDEDELED